MRTDTDRDLTKINVSIYEDQKQWARDQNINLSSLFRDAIDERKDG